MAAKKYQEPYVEALKKEILVRNSYLEEKSIKTVYFGGGTPSLLPVKGIMEIFNTLQKHFTIEDTAEITLEANPDDLTREKLGELAKTPVNRLSIGIQSFRDEDLQYLNRSHSAKKGIETIKTAQDKGFNNLNIDLIFGMPTLPNEALLNNLSTFFSLNIPHLSAYALTVEPKTPLELFIKQNKANPVDEDQAAQQFKLLMQEMEQHGFHHYEISNYCKPGFESIHNHAYWTGKPYLGLGASAHSYNGHSRQWNITNTSGYIALINEETTAYEKEELTISQKYNEYIFTGLRTSSGVDTTYMKSHFGEEFEAHFLKCIQPFLKQYFHVKNKNHYILNNDGKLYADSIASACFMIEGE